MKDDTEPRNVPASMRCYYLVYIIPTQPNRKYSVFPMEYYAALKRNKIKQCVMTWM